MDVEFPVYAGHAHDVETALVAAGSIGPFVIIQDSAPAPLVLGGDPDWPSLYFAEVVMTAPSGYLAVVGGHLVLLDDLENRPEGLLGPALGPARLGQSRPRRSGQSWLTAVYAESSGSIVCWATFMLASLVDATNADTSGF